MIIESLMYVVYSTRGQHSLHVVDYVTHGGRKGSMHLLGQYFSHYKACNGYTLIFVYIFMQQVALSQMSEQTGHPKIREDQERVQAIQKLQFHDFPLTTTSISKTTGAPQVTQAKILANKQLDIARLQSLQDHRSTASQPILTKSLLMTTAPSSTVVTFTSLSRSESVQSGGSGQTAPTLSITSILGAPRVPTSVSSTLNLTVSKDPVRSGTPTTSVGGTLPTTETLGRVPSVIDTPKSVVKDISRITTPTTNTGPPSTSSSPVTMTPSSMKSSPASSTGSSSGTPKAKSSATTSYTATSKPVLPTIASTRTRRIKTPKQYDL